MRPSRSRGFLVVALASAVVLASVARSVRAQSSGMPGSPVDLNLLALDWARGQFRAPMVCQVDGAPRQVLRPVLIAPGTLGVAPPQNRIQFPDSEAPGVTRCTSETGTPERRVGGTLHITIRGRSRPDTVQRDFDATMRRDRGFEYEIVSGRLRIGTFGEPDAPLREVDFTGGKASFRLVESGSDAERILADFPGRQGYTLEVSAPEGERLVFHIVRIAGR